MRNFIAPAIITAILATAPLAAFASENATGTVKNFDHSAMTLTLDNGMQYSLPTTFKDPGLKIGQKVNVTWEMRNSKHVADTVKIVN